MNEPQLSAEGKLNILELVDPKVPYSHFVRVLEKYTQEVIATALEEQKQELLVEKEKEWESVVMKTKAFGTLADKIDKKARHEEREKMLRLIAKDIASVLYKINGTKNIGGQLQFRQGKLDGLTKLYKKIELNQLKGIDAESK